MTAQGRLPQFGHIGVTIYPVMIAKNEDPPAMYASEHFFRQAPGRPAVPCWFKGLMVPLLILVALPLTLLVMAFVLALAAVRVLLRLVLPRQARPRAQRAGHSGPGPASRPEILTDVDYVVLDDTGPRR